MSKGRRGKGRKGRVKRKGTGVEAIETDKEKEREKEKGERTKEGKRGQTSKGEE